MWYKTTITSIGCSAAARALPTLLANRSACFLEDGQLEAAISDCTDALAAMEDERCSYLSQRPRPTPTDSTSASAVSAVSASASAFKIRLRRAEASRRLGRLDESCRQSDVLAGLATTKEEVAAAGYLALHLRVIAVE